MWSTLMAPSPSTIDRILVSSIFHVAALPHFASTCAPMLWSSITVGRSDDLPKRILPCLRKSITGVLPNARWSICGRKDMKMKYSVHTRARAHHTHTSSLVNSWLGCHFLLPPALSRASLASLASSDLASFAVFSNQRISSRACARVAQAVLPNSVRVRAYVDERA